MNPSVEPTRQALDRFRERKKISRTRSAPVTTEGIDADILEEINRPRCGHPDLYRGLAFSLRCRWPIGTPRLTFAFENQSAHLAENVARAAVQRAFHMWGSLDDLPFAFEQVPIFKKPDIIVAWRPSNDPDFPMGPGGGANPISHADWPPDCSSHVGSGRPLHFDDSGHKWADGEVAGALDLETVALHEIGHLLGLQHSEVAGAVMQEDIGPAFTRRNLHADDINGIRANYST